MTKCMQALQNEQPFQTADFLRHVCFINYYYSCSNCYYFTVPKRNVGFLSSVKDTIRRTRLKGAAKADGILAVKYIKLFSQVFAVRKIDLFFLFLSRKQFISWWVCISGLSRVLTFRIKTLKSNIILTESKSFIQMLFMLGIEKSLLLSKANNMRMCPASVFCLPHFQLTLVARLVEKQWFNVTQAVTCQMTYADQMKNINFEVDWGWT